MNHIQYPGQLGEAKVLARIMELKMEVYLPFSGQAPCDLITYDNETYKTYRVSVKTCWGKNKYDGYEVQLREIRTNSTGLKIKMFDSNSCDVLAVYIQPLDVVCFVPAKSILSKTTLTFREYGDKKINLQSNVIENYRDFPV